MRGGRFADFSVEEAKIIRPISHDFHFAAYTTEVSPVFAEPELKSLHSAQYLRVYTSTTGEVPWPVKK